MKNVTTGSALAASGMALLFVLPGCATSGPSTDPSASVGITEAPRVRYQLEELTKGGAPVVHEGWTSVWLPGELEGGIVRLSRVCNNPQFKVVSVEGTRWKTHKTAVESAEGCSGATHAVKETAISALTGNLTVRQSGDRLDITNGPYRILLAPV